VEQLAGAADGLGQKFMSFQADKARAKAWLEAAAGNAPVERLNTELAKRDEQIENLTTMLEALQAQVAKATTGKRALTAEPAAA
jgi:phage shock protein A